MKTILRWMRCLCYGLAAIAACGAARAEIRQTVSLPFEGVVHIHRTQTEPRELNLHLVLIDLETPGLRFMLTPPNGADVPGETTLETTRNFVWRVGAQIGINIPFYRPDPSEPYVDNLYLMVERGECYSGFGDGPAINLGRDNTATLITRAQDAPSSECLPAQDVVPYIAFGGNERIIEAGRNVAGWEETHPRTAVGITGTGQLMLAVVDGRNAGHSLGMTTPELAEVMLEYGAVEAINVDGGGSSTLVFADPTPRVVNVPVGFGNVPGTERPVGGSLVIFTALRETAEERNPPISEGDPRWYDTVTTDAKADRP